MVVGTGVTAGAAVGCVVKDINLTAVCVVVITVVISGITDGENAASTGAAFSTVGQATHVTAALAVGECIQRRFTTVGWISITV